MKGHSGIRGTMTLEGAPEIVVVLDDDGLICWADEYIYRPHLKINHWQADTGDA